MRNRVARPERAFVLSVVLVLASLFLPLSTVVWASHGTCEVDITPETATATLGTNVTYTITLRPQGTDTDIQTTTACATRAGGPVDISVEVFTANQAPTYNPGTIDGADTPLQPDLGCTIQNNQDSCTVQYTRTSPAGTDTVEAFAADEPNASDTATQTWTGAAAAFLNVEPESDSNPPQTAHVMTATARDVNGNPIAGMNIDFEITAGPNINLDNTKADRECVTNASGVCTVTYTDGAQNPAAPNNTDTICAWFDSPEDDGYNPFGSDATDGGDCDVEAAGESEDSPVQGSDTFGTDVTDVVQKTWAVTTLTMTPATDTASVGTCNAFTITMTGANGQPLQGAVIDVEQIHDLATNNQANDEPAVDFCTPDANAGANPSAVNTNDGDLRETGQGGDNAGTAGGETSGSTDAQGRVTIGVTIAAGNGSQGTGDVDVTAFLDQDADDDPDAGEPTDTSVKTWVAAEARTIDCEPETASVEVNFLHNVTCTVLDRFGAPIPGEGVSVTTEGFGSVTTATTQTTNASGQVTFGVTSNQLGGQTLTATLTDDLEGAEPGEVDGCDRAAGDPGGSPAGVCSDAVAVTWTAPTTGTPVPSICLSTPGAQIGSDAADVLTGTSGADVICGRGGDDTISGLDGNDILVGGPGNDTVRGGAGNDTVKGNGGADTLSGGRGADTLKGGGANDVLRGGSGPDFLAGGPGNDQMFGGRGSDRCRGGPGRDTERSC